MCVFCVQPTRLSIEQGVQEKALDSIWRGYIQEISSPCSGSDSRATARSARPQPATLGSWGAAPTRSTAELTISVKGVLAEGLSARHCLVVDLSPSTGCVTWIVGRSSVSITADGASIHTDSAPALAPSGGMEIETMSQRPVETRDPLGFQSPGCHQVVCSMAGAGRKTMAISNSPLGRPLGGKNRHIRIVIRQNKPLGYSAIAVE